MYNLKCFAILLQLLKMFSSLGTMQSMIKYAGKVSAGGLPPPATNVTLTAGSTSNSSINLNLNTLVYGPNTYLYSRTGYSIYTLLNTTTLPTTNTTGIDGTGSFTLTVTTNPTDIHFILIGAGGSGGSGNQGGGGGSAGEFKYVKVTLSVGTHTIAYTVGAGNGGSGYVASSTTFVEGGNGYGRTGNTTSITIDNGTPITAIGGSAGGPSNNSNFTTKGAYGGGAGCCIVTGIQTGSNGVIKNKGGGAPTNSYYGAGGGGSPMGNGSNGLSTGNPSAGGQGGTPISSNDASLSTSPFYGMKDNNNNYLYWCEGGPGSCLRTTLSVTTLNIFPAYGLAGKSSGVPDATATRATQTVNHSGSGGGGCFQNNGLNGTQYAPAGSNGLILIAF
jgi:hypothetical protein